MRRLLLLLATAVVALGIAGTTQAARLNWEGTTTIVLGDFPDHAYSKGGGVATVNGVGGATGGHLATLRMAQSRGVLTETAFTQPITDPESLAQNPIFGLQFLNLAGGTGTLGAISGNVSSGAFGTIGTMPAGGLVKLCIGNQKCTGVVNATLLFTQGPGTKGVGIGGLLTATVGTIVISVEGAPWQIKTATLIDHQTTPTNLVKTFVTKKYKGFAHDPSSGTTSTAQVGGVVQIIAPTIVTTTITTGSNIKIAALTYTLIRFIPEPGLLLLVGSGVAGLALLGRKRIRK